MPFTGTTIMERREECVLAALQEGANRAALYRHYRIDPKTGRRWIARYAAEGRAGRADRSRRPQSSPRQTASDLARQVDEFRAAHPTWGGRTIAARLRALGLPEVPAPSTITGILRRPGAAPRPRLRALRAGGPQRAVADRLHGAPPDPPGTGPSALDPRRSFPLRAGPVGLCP